MGRRLYYEDCYCTDFSSSVVRAEDGEEGLGRLVLEETCFYPESGGQLSDRGLLAGMEIVEVVEESGEIIHIVRGHELPVVGSTIQGSVDSRRRHHHRQQHSGQHVLSRVFENHLDLPTLSSRLGETGNTLDLKTPPLSPQQLLEIESAANHVVWEGRAIRFHYLEESDAQDEDRQKRPENEERVRIVEIHDFDRNACGGTHVRQTGEIGLIVITRSERVKELIRIHFLCGDRALQFYQNRNLLVSRLGQKLTTGDENLENAIEVLMEEARSSKRLAVHLAREVVQARVPVWLDQAEAFDVGSSRIRFVLQILPVELQSAANEAVSALSEHPDCLSGLLLPTGERFQILLGRGERVPLDCATLLKGTLQGIGGKGGGNAERARGGFAGVDPQPAIQALRNAIGGTGSGAG